jgi:hypothetical protein
MCAPSCAKGYNCRLDVIGSTCQCPVASCVKISFDTGAGNGDEDNSSSNESESSVAGPIIGAVAGLVAIALIAFFVIRKRRRQKPKSSVLMLGQDDSNDSFSKRFNPVRNSNFFHFLFVLLGIFPFPFTRVDSFREGGTCPVQQTG